MTASFAVLSNEIRHEFHVKGPATSLSTSNLAIPNPAVPKASLPAGLLTNGFWHYVVVMEIYNFTLIY